ncbi:MAG TPA: T9SS-dependent M36 family metallopeptidase [Flavobacterium sp.]|jgi:hypothetical protein
MKKITILLIFLLPLMGFSQSASQKIQAYLDANHIKFGHSSQDVSDWIIESEASSTSTMINNYYIKQRYQGTEIYYAVSNVWVKNDVVINIEDRFVSNIAQKVNAVAPTLSVTQAAAKAFQALSTAPVSVQIIESTDAKHFTLSNGALTEDPMTAELVYHLTAANKLRLAWDLNFFTQDYKHMWSVRIDAIDGSLLEKFDMIISCSFEAKSDHSGHDHAFDFNKKFFKSEQTLLDIQSGSYRVIPYNYESPSHSPRQLISTPHDPVASPYGWHDTNGIAGNEFTITRGNNVFAMDDRNANNGTDGVSPDGGASLTFDFPYGGVTDQPQTYLSAATTNLFYMSNVMHDVWYRYGFNEANGNFQQKNYTGFVQPGFGGDAVQADAQDGASVTPPNINNANFFTPVDGQKPRVQMYLWNVAPEPQPLHILSPADIAGPRGGRDNAFDPGHVAIPIAPNLIQSDLVLYDDGTPDIGQTDNADGCGPAVNAAAMVGKIVVIRRSTAEALGGTPCPFAEKVKNAQNAGAAGVVIVNNVSDPAVISMSGADATITIPAISVTMAVGEPLIARIKVETVVGKLQLSGAPYVNADGDFDNGIIAHEYGHGISGRLTGGPSNSGCLNNAEQQGEGWSDWVALMMQMKPGDVGTSPRGIATFALSQSPAGGGLRGFPYSTDMNVNPFTFGDTNGMTYVDENGNTRIDVHSVGSVWATMLWDLTWAYVEKYGYDPNIYTGTGGNNKVMTLIINAMKLQPCGPSFVNARDAIIAADQATTGGDDYCMIWEVFARRGLGVGASSGTNTGTAGINDQIESFTEPAPGPNCTLAVDYFTAEDMIRVYPNPSNGMVNVRINQFSGKVKMQVVDINGRVVFTAADDDFNVEKTIDLNHLASGVYLLKLQGEALNVTRKIIIN